MIMNNTVLSNSESPSGVLSEDISKEQLQGKILKVSFNQDFYSVGLKISYDIQLENFCGQTFKLRGLPGGLMLKHPPANGRAEEMQVQSLVQEDPLEKGMTTHFTILAWRTPMDRRT